MNSCQLLIPFGYLEVPLPAPCFFKFDKPFETNQLLCRCGCEVDLGGAFANRNSPERWQHHGPMFIPNPIVCQMLTNTCTLYIHRSLFFTTMLKLQLQVGSVLIFLFPDLTFIYQFYIIDTFPIFCKRYSIIWNPYVI